MSAVPQPSVRYERMSESDLDAVMAIEERIYEFPWTRGNFYDSMRSEYSCWLCLGPREVIGYAVMMEALGEVHLLNLSIDSAHQRRGHGARMLEFLLARARSEGNRQVFLEVRPSNLAARALYEDFGFKQIGLRRGYYPAKVNREDALVLALEL
jgi:ribosomal-protein-alanine N-acetyltransferase